MTTNNDLIDQYLDRFEKARAIDPDVDLGNYVPPQGSEHYRTIVTELIRVDMEHSYSRGQPRTLEDYQRRFPDVTEDPECLEQIAFEDYRLRALAGEAIFPSDYQSKLGIRTWQWPVLTSAESTRGDPEKVSVGGFGEPTLNTEVPEPVSLSTQPDLAGRMISGQLARLSTLAESLQRRLRFISLAIVLSLAYLSLLAVQNPNSKVGLFIGSPWLFWMNILILTGCGVISGTLWLRPRITLRTLRTMEVILFGSIVFELSCGLVSDLFIDHELAEPMSEGAHALFHYSSSWSLPFFALIVAYGTLVPSSWRRCTLMVLVMGVCPIVICAAAAINLHGLTASFFWSFLIQMALWMATAAAIAIYGVRRLEMSQQRALTSGKLGRYVLLNPIASGGMGEVYRAEHTLMKRLCAIKVMHPRWVRDEHLLQRFEREVQVLAAISHPNVVQVYDFGFTPQGAFYYVMEYLEGQNLEQRVKQRGPVPAPRVIEILIDLARALSVIHRGGIVHRDVKPSNIFLARSENVEMAKLLDFGLVKAAIDIDEDQTLTFDGAILGTPAYMSPEQASGKPVDHRTDIYSLGAVAHFALTGQHAFARDTATETMTAHLHVAPFSLSAKLNGLPPGLEEILMRCLSKDPTGRFATAADLVKALQAVKADPKPPNSDKGH